MLRDLLIFAAGSVSTVVLMFLWGYWLVHREEMTWVGWRRRQWRDERNGNSDDF